MLKIGSHSPALSIGNRLQKTSEALARSLNRLSSGNRLADTRNHVADVSMATGLDSQVRETLHAIRNTNDGMSLLQVADGSLSEMSNILQVMRELAVQASNGTLSPGDRSAISDQVAGLLAEIDRITTTTEMNSIHLFDGSQTGVELFVGGEVSNTVTLSLNDLRPNEIFEEVVGYGSFQHKTSFATQDLGSKVGGFLGVMDTSDLNGDGNLDLVQATLDGDSVEVFLGNGDGTFYSFALYEGMNDAREIKLADLNGDGIDDFIVGASDDNNMVVAFGNGDGSFGSRQAYAIGGAVSQFELQDFNNDGHLDLVALSDQLYVLLGNGDGTFQDGVVASNGSNTYVTGDAADIDGDDNLDIVARSNGAQTIDVYLGNGDGTFSTAVTYDSSNGLPEVLWSDYGFTDLADIDGDGDLDIVSSNAGSSFTFVYLGNGDGTFAAGDTYSHGLMDATLVDQNGDGILDIMGIAQSSDSILIRFGNGDGTFQDALLEPVELGAPNNLAVADFNGDGVLDAAIAGTGDLLEIQLGDGQTVSAVGGLTLSDADSSQDAIAIIDAAIDSVSSARAQVGSAHNRLDSTLSALYSKQESLSDAFGRLVDVDVATEMVELVRNQILQQAGVALLSQANQNQAIVLELLRF